MRQRDDIEESNITFPTLDSSNIVAVKTGKLGQPLLRQPASRSQLANLRSK